MPAIRSVSFRYVLIVAALITTQAMSQVLADGPRVSLSTSKGDIVLELNDARAPQTVKNFLQYVDDGFYDNTVFHRIIEGFMIQGGGFTQEYRRKPTRPPVSNEAYNGLRNEQYTIAMARTTNPHSATSQFFINSESNRNLDHTSTTQRGWGYTVFGKVIEGREIVDSIGQVRTSAGGPFSRDVPVEPVVILSTLRLLAEGNDLGTPSAASAAPSTDSNPTSGATAESDEKIVEQN